MQGGDVTVLDPRTLLVGVGNLTAEAAARALAQRLKMNVLAVRLPARFASDGRGLWTGLNSLFLHLDSIFTLVDSEWALVLPYFFEARHAGADPLTWMLSGLSKVPGPNREVLEWLATCLREVGWLSLYKAGSGEVDRSVEGMKLVDYLRARGYRIAEVGGPRGDEPDAKWIVERVLREAYFQAANVLAIAPGRVIAHEDNQHTNAALRASGVAVETFPAHELVRGHGGPHCMSMPLERAP